MTGLVDDGAYPFTEAETKAPSSASRVGTDAMRAVASAGAQAAPPARSAPAAPASQVPDWLEQAGYDEQIQVMSESRQGISRSPVHPVFGSDTRSRSVKRDTESILVKKRAESARKRKAVLVTLLVLALLGGGAWAGWEFYVKPNLPSSSRDGADPAPPVPPVASGPLPSGSGAEATLPTPAPEPKKPVSRTAKLGPEERRLVDSNVLGFFHTGDRQGLNVVVSFRKPVNISGIQGARIVGATDASGQPLPALSGVEAEIRLTDDPTGAMRVRLFVRGDAAAEASGSLRSIVVEIGPATIRARYDKELLSSR